MYYCAQIVPMYHLLLYTDCAMFCCTQIVPSPIVHRLYRCQRRVTLSESMATSAKSVARSSGDLVVVYGVVDFLDADVDAVAVASVKFAAKS